MAKQVRPKRESAMNLEDHMSQLNTGTKRDINILFFGETGVGKSTFINAFYNYIKYHDLENAMKDKPIVLIPAKFTIMDEDFKPQVVEIGADANEYIETGVSATQATKSYVFPIRKGNVNLRLIDTPGIADTRGVDLDNSNFENILDFISELKHLNAICVLLQPNSPRITVQFEYCIKQLLSKLDKSACNNLIFVFTNTRSTFYRPGETLPALQKMFKGIQNVEIPLVKNNIFCVDNEAFRFWTAQQSGVKFSKAHIVNFSESWKQSFTECWRMISYIAGKGNDAPLEPHLVKNTVTINEARRLIVNLSQPLAEIAQLIEDNITVLQRHQKVLQSSDQQITKLSDKLYIPFVNLNVTKLDQPTTVCTSTKCSELYEVNAVKKWHYKQKCHSPCYLTGVPKEIIGSPLLANCFAMARQPTCQKCGCEYQKHMHIYYETRTFTDKLEDEEVKSQIKDKKFVLFKAKNIVDKIERRLVEFKEEKDIILKTTAKFAHFLQNNAITPYNDAYEGYLLYLIDREKSLGAHVDYNVIRELELMLNRYKEEKQILSDAMDGQSACASTFTANEVIESVNTLYQLKHNGGKIKQLFLSQKSARKDENKSETREWVYSDNGNLKKRFRKKRCKKTLLQSSNNRTDSEMSGVEDGTQKNKEQNRRYLPPPLLRQFKGNPPPYSAIKKPSQEFENLEAMSNLKIHAEQGKIDVTFTNPSRENLNLNFASNCPQATTQGRASQSRQYHNSTMNHSHNDPRHNFGNRNNRENYFTSAMNHPHNNLRDNFSNHNNYGDFSNSNTMNHPHNDPRNNFGNRNNRGNHFASSMNYSHNDQRDNFANRNNFGNFSDSNSGNNPRNSSWNNFGNRNSRGNHSASTINHPHNNRRDNFANRNNSGNFSDTDTMNHSRNDPRSNFTIRNNSGNYYDTNTMNNPRNNFGNCNNRGNRSASTMNHPRNYWRNDFANRNNFGNYSDNTMNRDHSNSFNDLGNLNTGKSFEKQKIPNPSNQQNNAANPKKVSFHEQIANDNQVFNMNNYQNRANAPDKCYGKEKNQSKGQQTYHFLHIDSFSDSFSDSSSDSSSDFSTASEAFKF